MDVIWAPWRMAYIDGEKPEGCIFCCDPQPGNLRDNLILAVTSYSMVMLNKYPYNGGHLLVFPRRHAGSFDELPSEEYHELSDCLRKSVGLVRQVLCPGGTNLGMNLGKSAGAGVEGHLHWHIVPRWEGDTNFMPVVGDVRVIPQHLLDTYDRLRPHFLSLEGSSA